MIARFATVVLLLVFTAGIEAQEVNLEEITANDEFRWGVQALHDGKINEAIASLSRSLSFDSERSLTRYWLGRAYYYGGFEQSALDEWRWVAQRSGRTSVLEQWIERVQLSQGLTTERLGSAMSPGRYVTMVDLAGVQGELTLFRRPTSVRPRSDGYFYVVSFGTHRVVLLDPNGVRQQVIDGGIEGFDRPFDVLPLENGSLLVSEFGADRIAMVDRNGFKVGSFGSTGVRGGQLLGPQHMASDGNGHVYVGDYGNNRISKFTHDGEYLFSFGDSGRTEDRLGSPGGLVVMGDRVYVADPDRSRIAVYDENGNSFGFIRVDGMESPEGLSLYRPGELLVSDGSRVYVVAVERQTVTLLAEMNNRQRIIDAMIDANRNLVVADHASSTVLVMAANEELYTGLNVEVDFVNALDHPQVFAAVTVTDRSGRPLLGLDSTNFRITEDRFPTGASDLVYAGYRSREAAVALVVDRSAALADEPEAIRAAALDVFDALGPDDRLWVVGAGDQPVVEASPGDGRLVSADAAVGEASTYGTGRIDLGVRLGVSSLLGELGRRAIAIVSDGTLSPEAFENYSLSETAEHLTNNHVSLSVIYTRRNVSNPELDFLAEATDGSTVYLYQPEGAGVVVSEIRDRPSGSYMLLYNSVHDSDFGRRYIPLEIEAYLLERSGRDETGYFGPLEF
ncbi:MAG: hypothetical protein ACOC2N_02695 [Spirochaetota bacterium]